MYLTTNDTESEMAAKNTEIVRRRDVALPIPGGEGEHELYFQREKSGNWK